MKIKKSLDIELDAIAGVVAAVAAIVLHFMYLVDGHISLPIVLALLALLFLNFMRHARSNDLTAEQPERTTRAVSRIQSAIMHPDVIFIGPRHLRAANEQGLRQMSGDAIWFTVCLSMYRPEPLSDALSRPALENAMASSVQFVLDEGQRELWRQLIQPGIAACDGGAKVREPRWYRLSRTVSFTLADNHASGGPRRCSASGASRTWRRRSVGTCPASCPTCRRRPSSCRTWWSSSAAAGGRTVNRRGSRSGVDGLAAARVRAR